MTSLEANVWLFTVCENTFETYLVEFSWTESMGGPVILWSQVKALSKPVYILGILCTLNHEEMEINI